MAWSTADWWNASYTYRYCLDITAPGGEAVPAGYSCLLDINTATLVTAGKMLASRNDLRIVYWAGGVNTELDRHYVSASETWFKIQAEIVAGATSNAYFMYCGNAAATAPTVDFDNVYLWGDNFEDGEMADWSTALASGATLVASTTGAVEGTYSALLTPGTNAYISYWWDDFTATPTNAAIAIEARMKHDYSAMSGMFYLEVYHHPTSVYHIFFDGGTGNIKDRNYTVVQAWIDNTAYRIRIELDPTAALADAADVYVDGVSKITDASAHMAFTHIDRIRFYARKGPVADTSYFWVDSVLVRRLMATAPTVTQADEAQLVTVSKTIQFDVGTTTEVTVSKTITFDVWAATVTVSKTIQFDVLNQVTVSKTIQFDVAAWDWQGPIHGVYMTPSIHAVKMTDSTHTVIMTPSVHTVAMTRRT